VPSRYPETGTSSIENIGAKIGTFFPTRFFGTVRQMVDGLDKSALPFWGAAAFVARCARRCAQRYIEDHAEPNAARAAVEEAILLAEFRAGQGGDPATDEATQIDGRFFDPYDTEALSRALDAYREAALNTYTDLNDPESRRNLAAIELAGFALRAAFFAGSKNVESVGLDRVLDSIREGDERLLPYAEADLFLLLRLAEQENWTHEDGVPVEMFGSIGTT
jgi:hypothetical protein